MPDIEKCCRDCLFRRTATMECHRRAPVASSITLEAIWPIITDDNFCGDFEPFPYDKQN